MQNLSEKKAFVAELHKILQSNEDYLRALNPDIHQSRITRTHTNILYLTDEITKLEGEISEA